MKKTYNVLIIDDHQIIIDCYRSSIKQLEFSLEETDFNVSQAKDCQSGYNKIKTLKSELDLVFLDISLPSTKNEQFTSGEDLGLEIRNKFPSVKIIVCTSLADNLRLHNIMKTLNPEAFLIKSDIDSSDIVLALKKLINGGTYYSKTILNFLRSKVSASLVLDDLDIHILKEVSNAASMKELTKVIPLSRAAIEKRKRLLKSHFNIKNNSDRDLVLAAKQRGFI
ncbi:response regulator [Winogradskyella sp. SYSU M77433]|uniref:response regulator n=1 Tax=Winogradskyella sp. SYSU M77433 TaxID=3042722 RepID=UPI0024801C83|nr:response regulator [Winogradskyella sp. SYSU M77433]MDH7911374.1 response regulator [Winogradskyella sp. SYSU M77433]